MFNIGPLELIAILIVALLVIGPKKLPGLARALGKAVGEFKRSTDELRADLDIDLTSSVDHSTRDSHLTSTKNAKNKTQEQKKDESLPLKKKDHNDQ